MKLSQGNGGWFEVENADTGLPGRLYFKVSQVEGADQITELYIDGRGAALSQSGVSSLPITALREWARRFLTDFDRRGVPGPNLSLLASKFSTSWAMRIEKCESCDAPKRRLHDRWLNDWTALSWFAQFDEGGSAGAKQPNYSEQSNKSEDLPSLALNYEYRMPLTDEFLGEVAQAYRAAIARRMPPALTIAKLADVSPKTAQSWVHKARKRGIMPPAETRGRIF